MREKYVKEGYKVVKDPEWNGGEYDFYEIIDIDIDEGVVTLGELACNVRARQIPGTNQWKIKYIRVREKVIDDHDVRMSDLLSEYDVYKQSKKYSVVVNYDPGYDDWTSEYDSDHDYESDADSDSDSDSDSHKVADYTKTMLKHMVSVVC
ncbi:hypothetical protein OS493_021766 [Desmophyllum pertusum]|uniref:Uncharacterized protein n=1 Tax=Desmophyllum pertusum TaxID=174260 RepID=A0A9W9ZZZ6_9CNID|nr:hypothetical protein OS493_021766 [Desmophyllum pertusum]